MQRWELYVKAQEEHPEGNWVLYEDAQAAIVERDAEIERLRTREREYCEKRCFGHGETDVTNWVTEAAYKKLEAELAAIKGCSRPTPTLAEVAMHLLSGILANSDCDWADNKREVRSCMAVCEAEALLAELERRGE